MWTVEHGTGRDDEINRGTRGNFGWDPVPGYNEGRPITDLEKFPNAVRAAWSSGVPTLATSGATWLTGSQWGIWEDHLAVATLKDESLRIFRASPNGTKLTLVATLFKGRFGRLRAAQMGPDGALYLTTSNGNPQDRILRVVPGLTQAPNTSSSSWGGTTSSWSKVQLSGSRSGRQRSEAGAVAEAAGVDPLVGHLGHPLGAQRRERQVLLGVPPDCPPGMRPWLSTRAPRRSPTRPTGGRRGRRPGRARPRPPAPCGARRVNELATPMWCSRPSSS